MKTLQWLVIPYQIPVTADTLFYVRGLKPDEKYMAALAAYNEHGKLIGGSIGLTCRSVLATHPLPTLIAWGYLAQVRNLGPRQTGQIRELKDGTYFCYCAYVLRISSYSGFLWVVPTNTGIFLRGFKLCGESRT